MEVVGCSGLLEIVDRLDVLPIDPIDGCGERGSKQPLARLDVLDLDTLLITSQVPIANKERAVLSRHSKPHKAHSPYSHSKRRNFLCPYETLLFLPLVTSFSLTCAQARTSATGIGLRRGNRAQRIRRDSVSHTNLVRPLHLEDPYMPQKTRAKL